MEDPVSVCLEHLCVRVEARVAELGDLLGEQLDSVRRVAEDDRLVDLELQKRKERQERQESQRAQKGRLGDPRQSRVLTFEKRVLRQ